MSTEDLSNVDASFKLQKNFNPPWYDGNILTAVYCAGWQEMFLKAH